jgi:4-hydroxythreonine-4-phosphate dehydrogenase
MTKRPLLLTQGDPHGIGPELALKAWSRRHIDSLEPFALIGDPDVFARTARMLHIDAPLREAVPAEANDLFAHSIPLIPISAATPEAVTVQAIADAVHLIHRGEARAIVTNPITKAALYKTGFTYPGHTEFLGALAEELWGTPTRPVMMIWSELLAVVPITIHVPIADVPHLLTRELVIETARIVARDMRDKFGIAKPRLALAGLNPHAGESGTIGREDEDVLRPAVETLQAEGIAIVGPLSADTMFHAEARKAYDVALCPTHDQALIPAKTLAFDEGVNVTLGLPFIRTSPDHGTAPDIVGRGIARPTSLIAALKLAARLQP